LPQRRRPGLLLPALRSHHRPDRRPARSRPRVPLLHRRPQSSGRRAGADAARPADPPHARAGSGAGVLPPADDLAARHLPPDGPGDRQPERPPVLGRAHLQHSMRKCINPMKLNLSDEPVTAELLAEALARSGSAVIAVNGTSMHPTLQMGWQVYLRPARGADLKVGEIAVFRGDRHLTIHRLVWKERGDGPARLVFRGDYNRLRERVAPEAVLARVVAVEVPGPRKGMERVVTLERDLLSFFYLASFALYSLLRPILPASRPVERPPGFLGRAARRTFAALERLASLGLSERR